MTHAAVHAHLPGTPPRPGEPGWPGTPLTPGWPSTPPPARPDPLPVSPVWVWLDPLADWQASMYERLLEKRIVLASGTLDDQAAAALGPAAHPGRRGRGAITAVTTRQQQVTRMLDTLYYKLAEVTGREVDEIREDSPRRRSLTTAQAIGYGLIQAQETAPGPGPANPGLTAAAAASYEAGLM